jgi:hypothetical protein
MRNVKSLIKPVVVFAVLIGLVSVVNVSGVVFLSGCGGDGGTGGSGPGPGPGGKVDPSPNKPAGTDAAVKKALDNLAAVGGDWGYPVSVYNDPPGPVVFASFAGLAMLASGKATGSGAYADSLKLTADYVAFNIMKPNNLTPQWDQTNWSVCIGCLFLAEAFKATGDGSYKSPMATAASSIASNRMTSAGGYCHSADEIPNTLGYKEIAIMSNWAIMGMASAKYCGCSVSDGSISRACQYLETCARRNGGVSYSHTNNYTEGVQRTGSGVWACYIAGHTGGRDGMADYVRAHIGESHLGHGSACMGYLGGALGCIYCGQSEWDSFVSQYFQRILSKQDSAGFFPLFDGDGGDSDKCSKYYRTAVNALILQLDMGHLHFLGAQQ